MTVPPPRDLRALLDPTSVAVVGVGSDPASPGSRVFRNLLAHHRPPGADQQVYGVNRKAAVIEGVQTFATLDDLPAVPELVVVATPSETVEGLVDDCARLGVGAVVVLSAGFAEAGDDGKAAQARLVARAREAGMALIGPNSMGLMTVPSGLMATFTNAVQEENPGGRVAVVGQSGGMAAIVYTILLSQGIGVDHLVALGNEADVTFGEVAHWLLAEDRVDTVVGFVESLAGWPALADAARVAADKGATIAICRAGRSEAGASAAASHVGAVAGDDAVLRDLCRQHGIVDVASLDGLVDAAKARSAARPLGGDRIGVVTASGGAGTLLADLLSDAGLSTPTLSPQLQERIYEIIPWFGAAANPVDTTAYVQNRPEVFAEVSEVLCGSGEVDGVVLFLGTLDPIAERLVASITAAAKDHPDVPVVVAWGGGSRRFKADMARGGVATYDDPGRAVTGLLALRGSTVAPASERPALDLIPAPAEAGTLNEHQVRDLLAPLDLPLVAGRLATDPDDAAKAAAELGTAAVLKLVAPGAEHKSDIGGVRIGLEGDDAVRAAATDLLDLAAAHALEAEGVLVEAQAPGGIELLCAVRRDPVVGPAVVVGLGGRLTEVLAEVAIVAAPVAPDEAARAIRSLNGGRLADHHRGLSPAAVASVAALLSTLGDLAVAAPWLQDLELNPVIVAGDSLAICDGMATTRPPTDPATDPADEDPRS